MKDIIKNINIKNIICFFLIFAIFSNIFLPTLCFAIEESENEDAVNRNSSDLSNNTNKNELDKIQGNNTSEQSKEELPEEESKESEEKIEDENMEESVQEEKTEEVELKTNMLRSVNQTSDRIEDGIYEIASAKNKNKLLSIDNTSNAEIWERSNNKSQKFQVTYSSEGYYTIQIVNTEKVLDVYAGLRKNGTNVQAYQSNKSDAQKWIIKKETNGEYSIISKSSGLYLDIYAGDTINGSNVQIYEGNGSNAQRFVFNKVEEIKSEKTIEDGIYEIASAKNKNKLLSVDNTSNVEIWDRANNKSQKFQVTYSSEGYYTIQIVNTEKVLDVYAGLRKNGTNVQAYQSNKSDAQKWIIKKELNGEYSIISKSSGLYLDIYAGNTTNGSNVQIYEGNGSSAQKFVFNDLQKIKGERTIEDGMYKIKSAINSNMVLDISGGSKADFANVQIWEDSDVKQQKFHIKYIGNGFYTIRAVHSKKSVDVYAASQELGTNVNQYTYNGGNAQQWIIKDAGNGCYNIISKCNYLYLDIYAGATSNGTNVQMYEANGSNAQKFKFEKTEAQAIDDGTYEISMASNKNKIIEVNDSSREDGANVQIWDRLDRNCQKFNVFYNEANKEYIIEAVHSNKLLDVYAGLSTNGTNVQQYTNNNSKAQRWDIIDLGDGTYNIVSKCNGLYLDVYGGSTNNGTNVQVYQSNGSVAQLFEFTETTIKNESYSNFGSIDENKYRGYKAALQKLQQKYPNWTIRVYYTGLKWDEVINAQDVVIIDQYGNESARSLTNRTGKWKVGDKQYEPGWYRASRSAIEYMMDPRNSLDEKWIFQFQDLSSSSGSYSDIARMVSGTYLDSTNIINAILSASKQYKVSPFHLTSRFIQEQGNSGWCINGYECDFGLGKRKVYNYGNINATGSTTEEIIEKGAKYAYDNHWFTPETCINGTAQFLTKNYIGIGQSTLYYQKYNVKVKDYNHQYMTNIRAANDEGNTIYNAYKNSGLLESNFEFEIPVYENMPENACSSPSNL